MNVGIGGYFKIEAVNTETGERRVLADWFKNLITNQGLNRIGSGTFLGAVLVGSGSTPPANTDTQLVSHIASTTNFLSYNSGYVAGPPFYVWRRIVARFAQGAAAGNLSEVGVNWTGAAAGELFSRSLIKDGNGNPTSITVLATEFLDVTYELRFYPPQTDVTFQATISGQTHNCTLRPSYVSETANAWGGVGSQAQFINNSYFQAFTGSLGPVDGAPGGTYFSPGNFTITNNAYSNNSYERTAALNFGLGDLNNAAGMKSFVFQTTLGTYQVEFVPNIMKDSSKLLTLNFRITWARRP